MPFSESIKKFSDGKTCAIVRSYGDEPVVLRVIGPGPVPGRLLVVGEAGKTPISLPSYEVFPYSADLFQRLKSAFEKQDADGLKTIYGKEQNWTEKYCNR